MAERKAARAQGRELIFPLVPARRSARLDVAGLPSRRRGSGSEVASSRPYRRGDAVKLVDWRASARLSTALASDEFVVRDRFADDAARLLLVVDRSPSMALFPADLPWLHKPDVVREASRMIVGSGQAAHALLGFAEHGAEGPVFEHPRRDRTVARIIERRLAATTGDGPDGGLDGMLELLARSTLDIPSGTFAFVLSDFLRPPGRAAWRSMLASGWDVVPVVVQDPRWEQSFPDVANVALPLVDPRTGAPALVRLRPSEAAARRAANEERLRTLRDAFFELGVDPVLLSRADTGAIHAAFLSWAKRRSAWMRRVR
ncbi:MAG TPA: DUF58 domain-containing protein [Gaiella sp.]|jgi:uncharacterized protein (DUF58 family)